MSRQSNGRRNLAALAILFLFALPVQAQVPVTVAPTMKLQFFSNAGLPLANGCLSSFAAGTSNPQATYTDSTGTAQNTNPVILDAAGRADIWVTAQAYKFVLKSAGGVNCASGVQLWSEDNITGVLGLLSLPNTWTAAQTFSQAIKVTPTTNQIVVGTAPNLTTLNFPAPSGAKSLTFPNIADTMVSRTTTDTLTNKTLTSPTITTPILNGTTTGSGVSGNGSRLATAATTLASVSSPVCTDASLALSTDSCSGLTAIKSSVQLKAQTVALGTTNSYSCPAVTVPVGCFVRISYYLITQTAGTGTTVTVTLGWTDQETLTAETVTSSTINLGALGSVQQASIVAHMNNSTAVTYSTTVGAIGTSKYSLYVEVEGF